MGERRTTSNFCFGFAGYDYQAVTDTAVFMERISASIDRNKPVIAKKLKGNSVPFAVITGDTTGMKSSVRISGVLRNHPTPTVTLPALIRCILLVTGSRRNIGHSRTARNGSSDVMD